MSRSPVARIREVGDAALVLELGTSAGVGASLDIEVNRRATSIAWAVSQLAIRGVRDVVPTFRSVAV